MKAIRATFAKIFEIPRIQLVAIVWNVWITAVVLIDYYDVFNQVNLTNTEYAVGCIAALISIAQMLYVAGYTHRKLYEAAFVLSTCLWAFAAGYEFITRELFSAMTGAWFLIAWINLFALEAIRKASSRKN